MALMLPGERSPRLLGVLIAAAAVLALSAFGCATAASPPPRATHARAAHARADEGSAFVERALHREGYRFGTDGSTRALWGYLRASHRLVSPSGARPGDVLFFDTHATDEAPSCDAAVDHAAVVDSVAPDGRITFVEARGGAVRTSFVDPEHPAVRRSASGQIANSFLRAKGIDDPEGTRYLAGEMLCGVVRPER
jgi:hypothetical protein